MSQYECEGREVCVSQVVELDDLSTKCLSRLLTNGRVLSVSCDLHVIPACDTRIAGLRVEGRIGFEA